MQQGVVGMDPCVARLWGTYRCVYEVSIEGRVSGRPRDSARPMRWAVVDNYHNLRVIAYGRRNHAIERAVFGWCALACE